MYGWNKVLLRVNLADGSVRKEPIADELLQNCAGQFTLAAHCWEAARTSEIPENERLVLMTGPLTGTMSEGANRYALVSKSGGELHMDSLGGHFGAAMKLAGYDGIILEGRAKQPCYLSIHNNAAELRCAADIWGKNVDETVRALTAATTPNAGTLCIGPAGERDCAFAAAVGDRLHLSSGSAGTVMGGMRLKGIAVYGSGVLAVADPEAYLSCAVESRRAFSDDPFGICLGSNEFRVTANVLRNLQSRPHGGYRHLIRQLDWTEELACTTVVRRACHGCTVGCRKCVCMSEGISMLETPAPEQAEVFERACGVTAMEPQLKAFELCRQFGMDPVSCALVVGMAMRLADAGLLTEYGEAAGSFGNAEAMLRLVALTGTQEGIGAQTARGERAMTARFHAAQTAAQVRGALAGRCTVSTAAALRDTNESLLALAQDLGICPYAATAYSEALLCRTLQAALGLQIEGGELYRLGDAVRQILSHQTKGAGNG